MISPRRMTLLSAVSTNISGPIVQWNGEEPGTIQVFGTWDGATVTIYGSTDNEVTWTAIDDGVFTADSIKSFEAGQISVKAIVSGVGTSSLTAYLVPPQVNT